MGVKRQNIDKLNTAFASAVAVRHTVGEYFSGKCCRIVHIFSEKCCKQVGEIPEKCCKQVDEIGEKCYNIRIMKMELIVCYTEKPMKS